MAFIFKPTTKAAAAARPYAKRLYAQLRGRKGTRTLAVDGFLLQGIGDGKNVVVRVLEPPAMLGLFVGGGTARNMNDPEGSTSALLNSMIDAIAPLPLSVTELCYPPADFTPMAIQPKASGTQKGIVPVEGMPVVYGTGDDVSWETGAKTQRAFVTPNALLSVAVRVKYPSYNNPFREPVIGISRLATGSASPGITSYGAAASLADASYVEIDVYGLGYESVNADSVCGALEWGRHDGIVMVAFNSLHIIRYNVTTDDAPGDPPGSGQPLGHVLWRHKINIKHACGPFSLSAGQADGEKSCVFLGQTSLTEADGFTSHVINSLYRLAADGTLSSIELNRYTYHQAWEWPPIGTEQTNVYACSVLTSPTVDEFGAPVPAEQRLVAINRLDNAAEGEGEAFVSVTQAFRLLIYTELGGETAVTLPGMFPVNDWLGYYNRYSSGFIQRANRQRATICQYAPGYAAVLVSPILAVDPDYTTAMALHMAVIDVATGAVVGVSPALMTHSIMDGLCLTTIEQGEVLDGVITKHAKLLLSRVILSSQYRPYWAPLAPSEVYVVDGLNGATKVATCAHPASAYYLGTALKRAKIGQSTGVLGILDEPAAAP